MSPRLVMDTSDITITVRCYRVFERYEVTEDNGDISPFSQIDKFDHLDQAMRVAEARRVYFLALGLTPRVVHIQPRLDTQGELHERHLVVEPEWALTRQKAIS